MNLIIIILDSLRQDHVGLYHSGLAPFPDVPACDTPNLDKFGRQSLVFENVYADAYPTMPIRYQLMTGQRTLASRPWLPLQQGEITVTDLLRREGYVCGLISDNNHYLSPGMNFHRGFQSYDWIRGQEYDPYSSAPPRRSIDDYVNDKYPEVWRNRISQFISNTDDFERPEDYFAPRVVDRACRWLRANRSHKNIFLWVDSFDPHEPWDPPAEFDRYTYPDYRGKRLIMPMGGQASSWATDDEIREIRGLYAGESAFVDHSLGRLFETIESEGYLDDSLILLMSDHGHPLGDHGKFLKGADRLYNELLKIPLFLHLPKRDGQGRRVNALIQYPDILPTLLDLMGLGGNIDSMAGRSFRPVVAGDVNSHRKSVITGYHEGIDRCIRTTDWSLIVRPEGEPDELYNLIEDPREQRNLIDEHSDVALDLAGQFGQAYFRRGRTTALQGIQGKYEVSAAAVE